MRHEEWIKPNQAKLQVAFLRQENAKEKVRETCFYYAKHENVYAKNVKDKKMNN